MDVWLPEQPSAVWLEENAAAYTHKEFVCDHASRIFILDNVAFPFLSLILKSVKEKRAEWAAPESLLCKLAFN